MKRLSVMCIMAMCSGSACETVAGGSVQTSGLYAKLEAEAVGDGKLVVKATLTMGPSSLTYVSLAPGETLVAKAGAVAKTMNRRTLLGTTWYETEFPSDAAETALSIALNRPDDTSALESTLTLPGPFTIATPAAGTRFSRALPDGFNVTWSPPTSDELRVSARGSCIETVTDQPVAGSSTVADLPRFVAKSGSETAICDVQVSVVRFRKGRVDPAYGQGGDFEARVTRTLTVSSGP